ncbi:MAG: DNA repair protein RecN [Lachnospiraceae bacterium]|nr:DNA repair protein RecN [Lachnospiraceae bacterium]
MLESLSVRNFALIKEAHIDFRNNLNVLTGETGSGKSILIGSINLALGMRASKDYMRDENEDTTVSIAFSLEDQNLIKEIKDMDIPIDDDGKVIIYRKITKDKNIAKINDESSTLNKIKELTDKLIDIYGQHDGESLRKNARHIEFLDDFIGKESIDKKAVISKLYTELKEKKEKLDSFNLDERMRLREIDILKYEVDELEKANLKEGEEEELADRFKIVSNSKNIIESLTTAFNALQELNLSAAVKEVKSATKYDESLNDIYSSLMDCDSIISDSIKELDKKIDQYDIDEKEFAQMENRLDLIRGILAKYDNSVTKALSELDVKKKRLIELDDYDNEKQKAKEAVEKAEAKLEQAATELSDLRKKYSKDFIAKIVEELKDLGFLDVKFDISIERKTEITRDGFDEVTFMISLNTGEKMRALSDVASGGELSRIMLSIKTILSESYGTETLIFDEIDAGISGITASRVASKLNRIAKNHQVILITHLPQIAAMADNHFVIKKEVAGDRTITTIDQLDNKGMIEEIGRLISSSGELTKNVLANAEELKEAALKEKV